MKSHQIAGLSLTPLLLASGVWAQEMAPVVCSVDTPLVARGGTVSATVSTDPTLSVQGLTYTWSANGGGFVEHDSTDPRKATGSTVQWKAPDTDPALYTLAVSVAAGDRVLGKCSLDIVVKQNTRGGQSPSVGAPGFQTEGAILVHGSGERSGYGLYSYILIPNRPEPDSASRVEALLQTYLKQILTIKGMEGTFKSSQLNITYLPMIEAPGDGARSETILDNYDYARAKLLLSKVPGAHNVGPYILSSLKPLTEASSVEGPYLFEDLSAVPASVIPLWVNQFVIQTLQLRFWQADTLNTAALRLRTAIAVAAEGLPIVQKAVTSCITIVPGR